MFPSDVNFDYIATRFKGKQLSLMRFSRIRSIALYPSIVTKEGLSQDPPENWPYKWDGLIPWALRARCNVRRLRADIHARAAALFTQTYAWCESICEPRMEEGRKSVRRTSNRERDAPNFHTIQRVAGGRTLGRMHFDSYGATT